MNKNDYIKVVYQTEPIGAENIILYLTTFDIDKYNHDLEKKEFGIKVYIDSEIPKRNNMSMNEFLEELEVRLNGYVKNFYEPYINETKEYIKLLKSTYQSRIEPKIYDNTRNVVNVDKVVCNIVEGNVTNCDTIYCNEIKGKVINCDRIIYKKEE